MIARIRGTLTEVGDAAAYIAVDGLTYEVLVPAFARGELPAIGALIDLHTIYYLEGGPAVANLVPRLLGFPQIADRELFLALTRIRGVSSRKALRAMQAPTATLAAAIERGDEAFLTSLPEIGKKTAAQIVSELRGKLGALAATRASAPIASGSPAQSLAVDVLVTWGDRRADAQRWVEQAVTEAPELAEVDDMVRAAYRVKQRMS